MPACRQAILFVAGCLLAAIVSQANAQDPSARYYGSNARIVEFSEQRPSRPRRIAVVGDVMRPGVYQSSTRQLLASTLLTAAGSQALPGEYFTRFYNGLVPDPRKSLGNLSLGSTGLPRVATDSGAGR